VKEHSYLHDQYRGDERDAYGYFYCRQGCGLVFSTRSIRNSHEKGHPEFSSLVTDDTATSPESKEDHLYNYHRSKLVLGLTLMEFDDAIKEGDGKRLHDLYRFALLLFKAHHKTKYSYVVLLYLVKIAGALSEKDAHILMWNRFFNKHGLKGGNIPLDLRMEQMNK